MDLLFAVTNGNVIMVLTTFSFSNVFVYLFSYLFSFNGTADKNVSGIIWIHPMHPFGKKPIESIWKSEDKLEGDWTNCLLM